MTAPAPEKKKRGRPRNPALADERASVYLRPQVGERERWERAAERAKLTLHGWIRAQLNAATR